MEAYRYLIQYISDIRGIRVAKRRLQELEVYNAKFGAKVGQVTRVLGKDIQTSTKTVAGGATQHARTITRVFATASGQTYKYARTVTTAGGKVIKTTDKLAKTSKAMGTSLAAQAKGWAKLAVRAIAVIPIWMALRAAYMAVISSIRAVIKAQIDLDEGLARIETVVHGTTESIASDMVRIKTAILDMATKTRVSIKGLAEAYYFLQTSNLEVNEAMAAFIPTIDVMVGTGAKAEEVARGLAGMYATMGKKLGENLTITESMTKIADTLSYTYATQNVQMGELIQSYTKLAPYLTGLDDSFEDIVVMLGFLNTRLLRAGRAGRLTARSIMQLTKNAKKLADILGITFEPDEPISFLKTLGKIYIALGKTTDITVKQTEALRRIFAMRGQVPIRLLLASYEDLAEALEVAGDDLDGFAEKMRKIRMDTIQAQTERLRNVMLTLSVDFFTGAMNAEDLTEALKKLGDWFESLRIDVKAAGYTVGWFVSVIAELSKMEIKPTKWEIIFPQVGVITAAIRASKALGKAQAEGLFDIKKFVDEIQKGEAGIAKERAKQREILKKAGAIRELNLNRVSEEKAIASAILNTLRARGALEVEIAKTRLDSLDTIEEIVDDEEYEAELAKRRHAMIIANMNFRMQQEQKMNTFRINMFKATGASTLEIIQLQRRQLENRKSMVTQGKYLLDSLGLNLQKEIAITREKERQEQTYESLVMMYAKAGEEERKRIKRLIELMRLRPGTLAKRYRTEMFDRSIIEQYFRYFTDEGQEAVVKIARRLLDLPAFRYKAPKIADLPAFVISYGEKLEQEIRRAVIAGLKAPISEMEGMRLIQEQVLKIFPGGLDIKPEVNIKEIVVNLPEGSEDKIAIKIGEQVAEKLRTDPEFRKVFNKFFSEVKEKDLQ